MASIAQAASGFPNASGVIPPEIGQLQDILGAQGWNTYMVGKWHLCPDAEMNLASTRRNWPTGRGFERFYGFLGAETNQWFSGPGVRQPSRRPAAQAAVGTLSLFHGDAKVGEGRIKTQPGKFSLAGDGLCVGRDSGYPVTNDYPGRASLPAPGAAGCGRVTRVGDVASPRARASSRHG
jgi:hypothetical protein